MAQTTRRPTGQEQKKPSAAERRAERAAQLKREQERRQRRTLAIVALGAVVLALIAFLVLRARQVNQIGISLPDEGRTHVNEGTPITYKHYPPASGPHYPSPQEAGVYTTEVPEGKWVHSLEHGYVVALVKCPSGCPDTFEKFNALYKSGLPKSAYGNVKLVVTPYSHAFSDPSQEAPITTVAWDHELMLQTFDQDQIVAFYKQYVDKGPESSPDPSKMP